MLQRHFWTDVLLPEAAHRRWTQRGCPRKSSTTLQGTLYVAKNLAETRKYVLEARKGKEKQNQSETYFIRRCPKTVCFVTEEIRNVVIRSHSAPTLRLLYRKSIEPSFSVSSISQHRSSHEQTSHGITYEGHPCITSQHHINICMDDVSIRLIVSEKRQRRQNVRLNHVIWEKYLGNVFREFFVSFHIATHAHITTIPKKEKNENTT